MVVHYLGVKAPKRTASKAAKNVQSFHQRSKKLGGRGWSDIAYHFVIAKDGTVAAGRELLWDAFAEAPNSDEYISVLCDIGPNVPVPDPMRISLLLLHQSLCTEIGWHLEVCAHKDVSNTTCPGIPLVREVRKLEQWEPVGTSTALKSTHMVLLPEWELTSEPGAICLTWGNPPGKLPSQWEVHWCAATWEDRERARVEQQELPFNVSYDGVPNSSDRSRVISLADGDAVYSARLVARDGDSRYQTAWRDVYVPKAPSIPLSVVPTLTEVDALPPRGVVSTIEPETKQGPVRPTTHIINLQDVQEARNIRDTLHTAQVGLDTVMAYLNKRSDTDTSA